ncbi:hypothetical protein PENSPDRAFT_191383 [Peniophora sp. CONT]|nr:hypothetical protein PENSPDRAFT_191383 [Peniophora sp. CONT]
MGIRRYAQYAFLNSFVDAFVKQSSTYAERRGVSAGTSQKRELFQKRLGVVAEMKAIELKSTRDETGWPQIGNSTFFSLDALFEHYRLLHRDRDILSSVLILLYPCSEDDRLKDWINHYLDVFLDYNETNIDLNGFGGQMEEQAVMFADHMRERIKNGHRMM